MIVGLALLGIGLLFGLALALLIAFSRRSARESRSAASPSPAVVRRAMPPDSQLPDWRHADTPLLSLDQLGALMREIAARAGVPEGVLPHLGTMSDGEGAFIDRGASYYRYVGLERGGVSFEHRTPAADRLMYLVFCDRSWMLAAGYIAGNPEPPEQDPERIAERQQAILASIDPRWGRQFARDRRRGKEDG